MTEFINTLAVAVVSEAIHNSTTVHELHEVAQGIKASSYGERTREVLRLIYKSRKEELNHYGGSEPKHFED